jgi:hypothetical protein
MTVTTSWREGVLTDEESALLHASFVECLTGPAA